MALLTKTSVPDRQAIVIGASIAGLVTARVLANHVDRAVEAEQHADDEHLRATLVVDASGRSSRAPAYGSGYGPSTRSDQPWVAHIIDAGPFDVIVKG